MYMRDTFWAQYIRSYANGGKEEEDGRERENDRGSERENDRE